MSKFVRLLFLSVALLACALPMTGCGGPEYAKEGEGKDTLEPGAMENMTGMGGSPEKMKP